MDLHKIVKELIEFRKNKAGDMYDNAYRYSLINKDTGDKLMQEYREYVAETEKLLRGPK